MNNFKGIPYSDYFSVVVEWFVLDVDNSHTGGGGSDSSECEVKILLSFDFHKSTWLRGTIESNTK